MFWNKRKKYYVVWLKREAGTYRFIKKKLIAPNQTEVRFSKENKHPIDMQYPSYIRGNKIIYLFDVNKKQMTKNNKKVLNGGQLIFEGSNIEYDPALLAYVRTGIVRDLTATLHSKLIDGNAIFLMVLSAAAGILAGIFIAGFF